MSESSPEAMLQVRDLKASFFLRSGELRVLDGVSLSVREGESLGLVGETGSGKSMTAHSIIGLLRPPGRLVGGEILWSGRRLNGLPERRYAEVRGKEIAMVFQNARAALNPLATVGTQIGNVLRTRRGMRPKEARIEAISLLASVHIADPERRLSSYPHELSGGMAQRVAIAIALACNPRLLIADEPTTGLDVTVQYQLVQILRELRERTRLSLLLITHDLSLAAELCDRTAVLYAGRVAEDGPIEHLFRSPRHPYAGALLASRPRLDLRGPIPAIPGQVADLARPPDGCRFHPRCSRALVVCESIQPPLVSMPPGQLVACHNPIPLSEAR
jgi:oligopeptide/dipeptide ABC transporter ATP-binding protein